VQQLLFTSFTRTHAVIYARAMKAVRTM